MCSWLKTLQAGWTGAATASTYHLVQENLRTCRLALSPYSASRLTVLDKLPTTAASLDPDRCLFPTDVARAKHNYTGELLHLAFAASCRNTPSPHHPQLHSLPAHLPYFTTAIRHGWRAPHYVPRWDYSTRTFSVTPAAMMTSLQLYLSVDSTTTAAYVRILVADGDDWYGTNSFDEDATLQAADFLTLPVVWALAMPVFATVVLTARLDIQPPIEQHLPPGALPAKRDRSVTTAHRNFRYRISPSVKVFPGNRYLACWRDF